jgi:hypothetical protein
MAVSAWIEQLMCTHHIDPRFEFSDSRHSWQVVGNVDRLRHLHVSSHPERISCLASQVSTANHVRSHSLRLASCRRTYRFIDLRDMWLVEQNAVGPSRKRYHTAAMLQGPVITLVPAASCCRLTVHLSFPIANVD